MREKLLTVRRLLLYMMHSYYAEKESVDDYHKLLQKNRAPVQYMGGSIANR